MEITIEMIEQVLDATDADYRTVKQALIDHDGNVEEAIKDVQEKMEAEREKAESSDAAERPVEDVADGSTEEEATGSNSEDDIDKAEKEASEEKEENSDVDPVEELFSDEYADKIVDKLKERVKAGNVDRIQISRDGKIILDVPVNVGLIGGLFGLVTVPWAMILAAIAAIGLSCKVEIVTEDGDNEEI